MNPVILLFIIGVFILMMLVLIIRRPVKDWSRAKRDGVNIPLVELYFMRLRGVPSDVIVNTLITLKEKGVVCSHQELQAHYLAGGDVDKLADKLIKAKLAGKEITFNEISEQELATGSTILPSSDKPM